MSLVIVPASHTVPIVAFSCGECRRIERTSVPCCDGCGRIGGTNRISIAMLATLVHNLAIAAGLCASFDLAIDSCATSCEHWYGASDWRPGCGKAAP